MSVIGLAMWSSAGQLAAAAPRVGERAVDRLGNRFVAGMALVSCAMALQVLKK